MHARLRALVLATTMTASSGAFAQPKPDGAGAEALFQQGLALKDRGEWDEACKSFKASQELEVSPTNQLYVAACLDREGRVASAHREYNNAKNGALERTSWGADHRNTVLEVAGKEMARLAPLRPQLRIRVAYQPPGLVITQNDKKVALDLAVPVDPGEVTIRAEAPGFLSQRLTIELKQEETREVELELERDLELERREARRKAMSATIPPVEQPGLAQRIAGWATLSSGLASFAVATGLGVAAGVYVAQSDAECDGNDLCSSRGVDLRSRARVLEAPAWVFGGVGLAAMTSGVVALVTLPSSDGPSTTVAVSPTGVMIEAQW